MDGKATEWMEKATEWMGRRPNGWEGDRMDGKGDRMDEKETEWMGRQPNGWKGDRMDGKATEWITDRWLACDSNALGDSVQRVDSHIHRPRHGVEISPFK
jgi:hypothetical protein